jgi:hypothetical protein
MNVYDHIGPRNDQNFVATFERRPAEVIRGQRTLLQHGTHRAVEHQNAGGKSFL